jgi:hypothetical protein
LEMLYRSSLMLSSGSVSYLLRRRRQT